MLTYNGANALLAMLAGTGSTYTYSNVYVGLSTTAPDRTGGGYTEPDAGAGYARQLIGRSGNGSIDASTRKMNNPDMGATTNKNIIYFPEATDSWGTCTHFLIFNAEKDGVLIAYGPLTDEISPVAGTVPIIRVGDLTMSIS